MKIKHKKLFWTLSIITMIILLSVLVFYIAFNYNIKQSYGDYEDTINTEIDKINQINQLNFEDELTNENVDTFIPVIDENISSLKEIKNTLSSYANISEYTEMQKNLISGVNKNILIYKQISLILNNPDGINLDKSAEDLMGYKDSTIESYLSVSNLNFEISLPDKMLTFTDQTYDFAINNFRLNKDNQIKLDQNIAFVNSINEIIKNFLNTKKDFYTTVYYARTSKDFDGVVSKINENSKEFVSIKTNFEKLSPPSSEASDCYNKLDSLIDSYSSYLQSIKFAVQTEESMTTDEPIESDDLDDIYMSSNDKFELVSKNYSLFTTSLENYKSKYIENK
ncbi:MAG: hypothetical protein ACERKV_07730 [Clostridiaceae bacterium]